MRRVLAVVIGAAVAVGGVAVWAGTAGAADPAKREAGRACLAQAREELPGADKAALREAVRACLTEAGIEGPTPTPEQRAKRDAVRACIDAARSANPDDRPAARAAARDCLQEAGVRPGRIRAKVAGARECLAEVRAANPDLGRDELRPLVRECVAAK
jgi:pyruvate/2-oxoglutarate dehydrogenase complex dihydrolipoamide acyltransferase (E2) component